MKFKDSVYEAVKKIPKGKVSTYIEVARAAGNIKAWRAVGQILKKNPYDSVPCHRVVMSSGRVGGFRGKKSDIKKKMLEKEGVRFVGDCIIMEKYFVGLE